MKDLRIEDSDATIIDSVTNATGGNLVAGDGIVVAGGVAIYQNDVADTKAGPAMNGGVHNSRKVSAQAWTQGAKIYWDATAKLFTTVVAANTLAGWAYAAAANPSANGLLRVVTAPGT